MARLKKVYSVIFAAVLLGQVAGVGFAEKGMWELSIAPGYAKPIGSSSDYLKGSPAIDGSVLFALTDEVSMGLGMGYIFDSQLEGTIPEHILGDIDSDGIADPLDFTSTIDVSVLHLTPEIKLAPTFQEAEMPVRPYVSAGGGVYWTRYSAGTLTLTGTSTSGINLNGLSLDVEDDDNTNGGFNVGGGVEFQPRPYLRVGLNVRYHHVIYQDDDDLHFLIPSLLLTWTF
jgi:hypothetical protein